MSGTLQVNGPVLGLKSHVLGACLGLERSVLVNITGLSKYLDTREEELLRATKEENVLIY